MAWLNLIIKILVPGYSELGFLTLAVIIWENGFESVSLNLTKYTTTAWSWKFYSYMET